MKIVKVYDVPEATNPHKVSMRPLHDTPHVQVNIFDLKPGETLKMHTTPVDAFFYILEGRGVVVVGARRTGGVCQHACRQPGPYSAPFEEYRR